MERSAALYDEGAREMRERAVRAAGLAYPDPDAMIRAIASLPATPSPLRREEVSAVSISPTELEIRNGAASTRLSGGNVATIAAWLGHMRGHGRAWGETYLAGVLHGLAHAAATQLADVLKDIEAGRKRRRDAAPRPDAS